MMKVLHINCNYMETALHQTMIEKLDLMVSNTVFCPIHEKNERLTKPNENVIVSQCFSYKDRYIYSLKQHKIYNSLKNSCDVRIFDCVHAYTLFTDGNVAMNIKRDYGIPYVVAVRNTDMYFFKKAFYLRKRGIKILENASAIFFLSESTRDRLFEQYIPIKVASFLMKKIHIVPNGVDDFWADNLYLNRDYIKIADRLKRKNLKVVCVGRITKIKNIPIVQRAIQEMANKGWTIQLDVIGKNEDDKELQVITKCRNTIYHKPMPKEKLINYYRDSDIFVLASVAETFGLVYVEAMSQGLPVVYTKGQGFDCQFPEGCVGYHVDGHSQNDIIDALYKIVDRYEEISRKCIENTKLFRWDGIVSRYRDVYYSCVEDTNMQGNYK